MDELTHEFPYELGGDLKYIETLDHGAFGTVIHVIEISTNKDLAVKVINKNNSKQTSINKMKEEISILKKLNHENIVKFIGYFETNNQFLIKMEYIKYGTLSNWIKKHKNITEEEASIILYHILSAVSYLHSKQICHRDIKPENIMLGKENDLHSIKIIDFGLSAQHFDKLKNNDYCGTYIYMAPEQIEKKLYFISVDIWSIGILMFILLNNGKHPFYKKGDNKTQFAKKIMEGKINFYNKVSPMAKHLLLKLLEPNPSWRYSGNQAINHPWITRNINDEIPLTFNELLIKSNHKKIAKDLFNICLFMNYFSRQKRKGFKITQRYIQLCNLFDKKFKDKEKKRKIKCLDVISNDEDEDSDDIIDIDKDISLRQREKANSLHLTKRKNSIIIHSTKRITQSKNGEYNIIGKIKSSKIIHNLIERIGDKYNNNSYFKILSCKGTISSNAKIVPTYKKRINNINKIKNSIHSTLIKSSSSSLNKNKVKNIINSNRDNNKKYDEEKNSKVQEIKEYKENGNKEKSNKELNLSKLYHKINADFDNDYKYYTSKKVNNNLPSIISPQRLNYSKQQFLLNDIDTLNILPIVLPNIGKIQKFRNLRNVRRKSGNVDK